MEVQDRLKEKMDKTLNALEEAFKTVRAGRANPALLDKIVVEYYGAPTPLKQVANVSTPDPRTIVIQPFDASIIHEIEKAVTNANLGVSPSNDGKVIRLTIPQLTEDRRKELTKQVKKMGEEAKVAIRNERREANDKIKKMEKEGALTEDDVKDSVTEVQEMIDGKIKEVDKAVESKINEIMEI